MDTGQAAFLKRSLGESPSDHRTDQKRSDFRVSPRPRNVLILDVDKPCFPINVDVIHTISNAAFRSRREKVLRIVTVRRQEGIRAVVEFDSITSARTAKNYLHDTDIYPGCCALSVQFCESSTLIVERNDEETWDYTRNGQDHQTSRNGSHRRLGSPSRNPDDRKRQRRSSEEERDSSRSQTSFREPGAHQFQKSQKSESTVVQVTGMHPTKMNCDRVFNIFCLYGNIRRVNFEKVEGSVMVEMENEVFQQRAIANLNGVVVFGYKWNLKPACSSLRISRDPEMFQLADKSASFIDYTKYRGNRVRRDGALTRVVAPGRVLYIPRISSCFGEADVQKLFQDVCLNPMSVSLVRRRMGEPIAAVVEFKELDEAVDALTLVNNRRYRSSDSGMLSTFWLFFNDHEVRYQLCGKN